MVLYIEERFDENGHKPWVDQKP